MLPVAPARAGRVDDVARRQAIAAGDLRLASTAAVKTAALIEQAGPGGHVDGAVYPAATEQRAVGGVDDGVSVRSGDVAQHDEKHKSHLTEKCRKADSIKKLLKF